LNIFGLSVFFIFKVRSLQIYGNILSVTLNPVAFFAHWTYVGPKFSKRAAGTRGTSFPQIYREGTHLHASLGPTFVL